MEFINQANLFFAIAAPVAMIFGLNAVMQRAADRRPLFTNHDAIAPFPAGFLSGATERRAANDAQHQRAA
jgi:hypothetical protein